MTMTRTTFTETAERILWDAHLATDLDAEFHANDDTDRGASLTMGDRRLVMGDEYDHDAVAGTDDDAPFWGVTWTTYARVPADMEADGWWGDGWEDVSTDGAPAENLDYARAAVAAWIDAGRE